MSAATHVWQDPYAAHRRAVMRQHGSTYDTFRTAAVDDVIDVNIAMLLADIATPRNAWRANAACRDMNVDVFFPTTLAGLAEAQAVCGTCPVRTDCFAYADSMAEIAGVWGGHVADVRVPSRSPAEHLWRRRQDTPYSRPPIGCIDCASPIGRAALGRGTPRVRCESCHSLERRRQKMRWHLREGHTNEWNKWVPA